MLATILISIWLSFSLWGKDCLVERAVFDIGSGSIKMVQGQVDLCLGKVISIKKRLSEKVKFKEDLSTNKGAFSLGIQAQGLNAMGKLKNQVDKGVPILAVATSAFRDARNAQEYVDDIEKNINIKVYIISQEEEAKFGLKAVLSQGKYKEEDILVWDIGGGSMQFSAMENENFRYALHGRGSVPTKNWFLQDIQKKLIGSSPLPVADFEIDAGVKKLSQNIRDEIDRKIAQLAPKRKVIGIGGVIYFNICPRIEGKELGCEFNKKELDGVLNKLAGKSAEDLGGGPFVDEAITNPMLVRSFMENLKIDTIQTLEVNLSDGVMIDKTIWGESAAL